MCCTHSTIAEDHFFASSLKVRGLSLKAASFLQAVFGWSNCFLEHQAQKFSIMLANLINFNIQVLLGIQTSHLCFQTCAKVLNRSSVLSSTHLEKSTADAMHKHYMQEIKTPKGDLASPWSNLQRLVLMQ